MPGRSGPRPEVEVTAEQAVAFRLQRHHLSERASPGSTARVLADVNGAQAQLLSAAQVSLWSRIRNLEPDELVTALWTDRTLVRAWCMRRTLYLLPARELPVYARGTAGRAAKEVRWIRNRGVSERSLGRAIAAVMASLESPRTLGEAAVAIGERIGGGVHHRRGGGWGSQRDVPWVRVGRLRLPVGYLLHVSGAVGAICSGPPRGSQSTYVAAAHWIPGWRDLEVNEAERELLHRYLRAFGPATPWDFATWSGLRKTDVDALWHDEADRLAPVSFAGSVSWVERDDLEHLRSAILDEGSVRLLPYFDSYLLGHRDHRSVVDGRHLDRVFRPQGWVSPTIVWKGRVVGVWGLQEDDAGIRVRLEPLRRLPSAVLTSARNEATELGSFLTSVRSSRAPNRSE